jgi:hypothetical protein
MAIRELSGFRLTLWKQNAYGAGAHAHRASVHVLFVGQTGAIQGQLESSTEFHSKCALFRRGEGENALALPSLVLGEDSDRGSLSSSELAAD